MPFLAFLLAVAYLPGVMSPSTVGRWTVLFIGVPLLLFRVLPIAWVGGVLFVWMGLGLFWSLSPWDTAGAILHWFVFAGLFLWAMTQKDLGSVWIGFALGVAVSFPFVILQALGHHPVADVARMGYPSPGGLFLTSNVLAECSMIGFVAMIGSQRFWLPFTLGPLMLLLAILSGRSEIYLMILVAMFGYMFLKTDRHRGWVVLLACLFAVLFLIPVYMTGIPISWVDRLQIWTATVQSLRWQGWGLGSFSAFLPFAHNEALQFIFELGVGSVIVFGVVGYALLATTAALEWILLLVILASAMVWAPLHDPTTGAIAVILTGFLCGVRLRHSRAQFASRTSNLFGPQHPRHFGLRNLRTIIGGHQAISI